MEAPLLHQQVMAMYNKKAQMRQPDILGVRNRGGPTYGAGRAADAKNVTGAPRATKTKLGVQTYRTLAMGAQSKNEAVRVRRLPAQLATATQPKELPPTFRRPKANTANSPGLFMGGDPQLTKKLIRRSLPSKPISVGTSHPFIRGNKAPVDLRRKIEGSGLGLGLKKKKRVVKKASANSALKAVTALLSKGKVGPKTVAKAVRQVKKVKLPRNQEALKEEAVKDLQKAKENSSDKGWLHRGVDTLLGAIGCGCSCGGCVKKKLTKRRPKKKQMARHSSGWGSGLVEDVEPGMLENRQGRGLVENDDGGGLVDGAGSNSHSKRKAPKRTIPPSRRASTSPWIKHVKAWATYHDLSYKDALKDTACRQAYHSSG